MKCDKRGCTYNTAGNCPLDCDKREIRPQKEPVNILHLACVDEDKDPFIYVSAPDIDTARELAEKDWRLEDMTDKLQCRPLLDRNGEPYKTEIPTRVLTASEVIEWRQNHPMDVWEGRA